MAGDRYPVAKQVFPRGCRLLQAQGFAQVFAFRKTIRSEHFQLSYRPRQPMDEIIQGVADSSGGSVESVAASGARFGVVMAKKLAPLAVIRNRLKRQGREVFRRRRAALPALDLVLRLTKRLPAAPWSQISAQVRGEIETLFARVPR